LAGLADLIAFAGFAALVGFDLTGLTALAAGFDGFALLTDFDGFAGAFFFAGALFGRAAAFFATLFFAGVAAFFACTFAIRPSPANPLENEWRNIAAAQP